MNTFSYQLKKEVASVLPNGDDESLSQLSAIIKTCGEITKNGTQEKLLIFTEIEEVAKLVEDIIKNLYGADIKINIAQSAFSKNKRYEIMLPADISKQVLLDTEVMQYDEEKYLVFVPNISEYMIAEENKELAFLRGVFVGCFSCNINLNDMEKDLLPSDISNLSKNHSGYHAEFVFSNETFARDFCVLLADFDIISKMTPRKNTFVVYVKGLDMVSDLLALVGATKGSPKLQNIGVIRSVRNNINRQNNCISANLTKTVDASVKQMQAIEKIQKTIGIEALDEPLKEVVYLRLANPEESLDSLIKLSTKPISKSGLYHRLKKLEKIAEKL